MPSKWSLEQEAIKRSELEQLYVTENRPLREVAGILGIAESTVYDRIIRLKLPVLRHKKARYNNIRTDIVIPEYSRELAEFIGVMLGDGNLTPTQVAVTLGKKERGYIEYVAQLMSRLFGVVPKIFITKDKDYVVYFGSTVVVRWLRSMGLVFNKVREQVDVPSWIFKRAEFMGATLRGLYDTDGSIYKLRYGRQISFCNRSTPLLRSVQFMLTKLGFHASKISGKNIYLTRRHELDKFYQEVGFKNEKHIKRFETFVIGRVA